MFCLIFKPRAVRMAKAAYDWYEDQRQGLGEQFLNDLDRCYDKLEKFPEAYQKKEHDFRQIQLTRFPYIVIFDLSDRHVIVHDVFHLKKDPDRKFRQESQIKI